MKLLLVVLVGTVVLLHFPQEGEAQCCPSDRIGRCGDNSVATPCCGYVSCNIFCCNCGSRGCRNLRRRRHAGVHPMEDLVRQKRNGHSIVALGDQDGDGKMSLDEGLAYLDHMPEKEVVKRSLKELDLDGDGFLAPHEVDHTV